MVIDATLKCATPEISLPTRAHMLNVLRRWSEYGLPELAARERLERLLARHTDGLCFDVGREGPSAFLCPSGRRAES
jgi:hypothetical protein